MERRKFLKNSALASTAFMVPSFLKGYVNENGSQSRSGKVLVVVQLSGGNDGLNMLIPKDQIDGIGLYKAIVETATPHTLYANRVGHDVESVPLQMA